ncbi:MAG: hypothetical protein DWQ01_05345 [Planctomycetota bacterium]|nr:MAG: hypothetical protein DWQ01_05345 [Planctomycetota bacterium]
MPSGRASLSPSLASGFISDRSFQDSSGPERLEGGHRFTERAGEFGHDSPHRWPEGSDLDFGRVSGGPN